jgi:hypothetical protein
MRCTTCNDCCRADVTHVGHTRPTRITHVNHTHHTHLSQLMYVGHTDVSLSLSYLELRPQHHHLPLVLPQLGPVPAEHGGVLLYRYCLGGGLTLLCQVRTMTWQIMT